MRKVFHGYQGLSQKKGIFAGLVPASPRMKRKPTFWEASRFAGQARNSGFLYFRCNRLQGCLTDDKKYLIEIVSKRAPGTQIIMKMFLT